MRVKKEFKVNKLRYRIKGHSYNANMFFKTKEHARHDFSGKSFDSWFHPVGLENGICKITARTFIIEPCKVISKTELGSIEDQTQLFEALVVRSESKFSFIVASARKLGGLTRATRAINTDLNYVRDVGQREDSSGFDSVVGPGGKKPPNLESGMLRPQAPPSPQIASHRKGV